MLNPALPTPDSRADADLVQASRQGDRDAFTSIVVRYQNLICSMAYSALGDVGRSEDIAQETFVAAWQNLVQLRDPSRFRAWLCGIARNLIHKTLRRAGREPTHGAAEIDTTAPPVAETLPPFDQAITEEEAGILWRSLQRIPDTYRVPMVLFYREQQSIEAVARSLGLSEDAVRQRLSRGRKMLEDEVLRFVESALTRTSPDHRFTRAVAAALPGSASVTQLAATSAAAKGLLGSIGWFAWVNAATMIGASLVAWKTAIDEASSPRMRRALARLAWIPIACLVFTLAASWFALPPLGGRPALLGLAIGLLLLGNGAVMMLVGQRLQRLHHEATPEGSPAIQSPPRATPPLTATQATTKAARLVLPCLILLGVGTWGLPWKSHPTHCLVILLAELLLVTWGVLRFRRQLMAASHPITMHSQCPGVPAAKSGPWAIPLILGGTAVFAALIPLFLHPVGSSLRPEVTSRLGWIGLGILGGTLALGLVAKFIASPSPETDSTNAAIDRVYAPFFAEFPDARYLATALKAHLVRRTAASTRATLAWMYGHADPDPCLKEVRQCDEQIRKLLSPEGHAALRWFEKTLPDRERIERFRKQSTHSSPEFSAEQEKQLVVALAEARSRTNWSQSLSRRESITTDLSSVFHSTSLDHYEREEAALIDAFRPHLESILGARLAAEFHQFSLNDLRSRVAELRRLGASTRVDGEFGHFGTPTVCR
jgi:RNA polymerase sigma factor (sigma-70 family)